MSLLKQIGIDIVKIIGVVAGFAPLANITAPAEAQTITKVISELQQIASVVVGVEAVGAALTPNLTGAQKLQAATPLVAQVILRSDLLIGHDIADAALFQNGAEQIASGLVNVLNSLKAKA